MAAEKKADKPKRTFGKNCPDCGIVQCTSGRQTKCPKCGKTLIAKEKKAKPTVSRQSDEPTISDLKKVKEAFADYEEFEQFLAILTKAEELGGAEKVKKCMDAILELRE